MVVLLAVASCNGILGIEEATEVSGDASLGGSGGLGGGSGATGGSGGTAGATGGASGAGAGGGTGGSAGEGTGGGPSDGGDASDADADCGANLQTDGANCGACGHDCLGGQCLAGKCQPVKLGNIAYGANDLALGPNDVFVVSGFGKAMHKVGKTGGVVGTWGSDFALVQLREWQGTMYFNEYTAQTIHEVAATGALLPQEFYFSNAVIDSLAVDATGVYFAECSGISTGFLRHLPLSGGATPGALTGSIPCPEQIVMDATSIYFTVGYDPPALYKMPKTGGAPATLTTTTDATWALAIDGTELYYSTFDGGVFTIQTNGTGKVPLSGGFNDPGKLLVDSGYLYVTTRGSLAQNYADGAVYRMKLGVTSPTVEPVVENQPQPTGIASDANAIYWSNRGVAPDGQGAIWKLAK
jgi:hypothetical protein